MNYYNQKEITRIFIVVLVAGFIIFLFSLVCYAGMMETAQGPCGYSKEFRIGGRFKSFDKIDLEAALCKKCTELVVVNKRDTKVFLSKVSSRSHAL